MNTGYFVIKKGIKNPIKEKAKYDLLISCSLTVIIMCNVIGLLVLSNWREV